MKQPFLVCVEVAVRGYEIDVFNHVNNAVYLHWLEHARWGLVGPEGILPEEPGILPIVRHVELDFQAETRLGDVVSIGLWPRSRRTTSFTLGGQIRITKALDPKRQGVIATLATQVITCVKRGAGKTPVPDSWGAVFPAEDPGPGPFPA
jgi:YbgC/YbaW family acyl-CoA thioester hydrolase